MSIPVFPLLQAAPSATGSMLTTLIPFGIVILIFYFLLIRPQNKKQKETERMLSTLKKGDKVVTIGGIHGVIQSVKESTVIVKIDDASKIELNRGAVASVVDSSQTLKTAKADQVTKPSRSGKKALPEAATEAPNETESQ